MAKTMQNYLPIARICKRFYARNRLKVVYIFAFLAIAFSIFSCYAPNPNITSSGSRTNAYDFSSLYNPGKSILHPAQRVYINSDSTAILFFNIAISELRNIQEKKDTNKLKLNTRYVLRNYETNEISDSSSNIFFTDNDRNLKKLSSYLNIKIYEKKKYRLVSLFWGNSLNNIKRTLAFIDNTTTFSKDNFLLEKINDTSTEIVYNDFVHPRAPYIIRSVNKEKISIEYYKFPNYTVRPPHSIFITTINQAEADTVFEYKFGDTIYFPEKGTYFLKDQSQEKPSLILLAVNNSYPDILTVGDMLEPLKLVTTSKEYKKIQESENIKKEIDSFWISRSNNQKIAKEQILVFYNRVKLANTYFSENIEGWKTDRGNIYVIFGPPSTVNISDTQEEWFYGENPNIAALSFVFEKKENPYFGTSYQLIRDNTYQPNWAQALSTWRKGRVFTF
ncbi:GWxTD domain-containing protein [Bacteroidales bacterium OttesenSCG-928-I21]|nr:GWxTD domain-containing protein [Bacteroidales bacterium OttesenSCG-928-I21]